MSSYHDMFMGFVSMRSVTDGFLIVMLKSLKASMLLAPTKRPEFAGFFVFSRFSYGNVICLDYMRFTLEGGNPKGKLEEVTHVCDEFLNEVQSKGEHKVFGKMPLLKKSSNTDADSMDDASEFVHKATESIDFGSNHFLDRDLAFQELFANLGSEFIYGPLVWFCLACLGEILNGKNITLAGVKTFMVDGWHMLDANAEKDLTSKQVSMIISSLAMVTLVMHKFDVAIVECGRAEVLLITSEPHGKLKCTYSDVAWALNRGKGELFSPQIDGWLFVRNGCSQWLDEFSFRFAIFMLFSGGAKHCVDTFGLQYYAFSCNGLCKNERFLMTLFGLEISIFIDMDFDYLEYVLLATPVEVMEGSVDATEVIPNEIYVRLRGKIEKNRKLLDAISLIEDARLQVSYSEVQVRNCWEDQVELGYLDLRMGTRWFLPILIFFSCVTILLGEL